MSPHLPVDFVPGAPLQAPLHLAVRLRLAQAKIVVVIVVSLRNNNQKCRKPVYDNPPSETRQKPRARLLTWLKAAPLLRFLCDISRLLRGGQSRTGSSCYRPVPIAPLPIPDPLPAPNSRARGLQEPSERPRGPAAGRGPSAITRSPHRGPPPPCACAQAARPPCLLIGSSLSAPPFSIGYAPPPVPASGCDWARGAGHAPLSRRVPVAVPRAPSPRVWKKGGKSFLPQAGKMAANGRSLSPVSLQVWK